MAVVAVTNTLQPVKVFESIKLRVWKQKIQLFVSSKALKRATYLQTVGVQLRTFPGEERVHLHKQTTHVFKTTAVA